MPRTLARRRPVLSVVIGDNADLMVEVAKLWIPPAAQVLDATYGRGLFWTKFAPRYLTAWTGDFLAMPYGPDSFDVVVYDPPYTSTGGTPTAPGVQDMSDRYGMDEVKGWRALLKMNALGLANMAAISRGLVLVKTADYVESGSRRWGHQNILDTAPHLGLKRVDEFVLVSGPGPQPKHNLDGTRRRQEHSRRAHSFLVVFKKTRTGADGGGRTEGRPRTRPGRASRPSEP
jgi:hypothetical protein